MAELFEGRDFTDAVFWGVDLTNAKLRDVNFTGARMKNVWLVDVDIDGLVDRLVVNGVDVTEFVNQHDPWFALRGMLRPDSIGRPASSAGRARCCLGCVLAVRTEQSGQLRAFVDGLS